MISTTLMAVALAAAPTDPALMARMLEWAHVDEPWQIWLVGFGMAAQTLFFCRWLVQWFSSEKRGESHIPAAFWWLSLSGATLLLIYYVIRHEPVGVLGQCVGWIVYARNLWLIRRNANAPKAT
jgi:lipid-A-disaccharide synthase-like uncharacterized protein